MRFASFPCQTIAFGNLWSPTQQDTVWAKDLPTAPGAASFAEYVIGDCGFGKHVKTTLRANRKSGTPQATRGILPWNKMFWGVTKAWAVRRSRVEVKGKIKILLICLNDQRVGWDEGQGNEEEELKYSTVSRDSTVWVTRQDAGSSFLLLFLASTSCF